MSAYDARPLADYDIGQCAVGPDHGILPDRRTPVQLHTRLEDHVAREPDGHIDPGVGRVDHGDPVLHPPVQGSPVELGRETGELGTVVGALDLHDVVDPVRADRPTSRAIATTSVR